MRWALANACVVVIMLPMTAAAVAGKGGSWRIDAIPATEPLPRRDLLYSSAETVAHRFKIELAGARARAETWLQDAGFSLLERRDVQGKSTYTVISGPLTLHWPALRFRTRFGHPYLSAGLHPRGHTPAVGFVLLLENLTVELEGLDDEDLGYAFMGVLRWPGSRGRVQYGIAVPVALKDRAELGFLLQVRLPLGH